MSSDTRKLIAVIGATGQQGGGVLRALQASREFRVRALTRKPSQHRGLADEVVAADLNRPETLNTALEGAYGVFAVTNPWEPGNADEITQASALIRAAKDAGVEHFVWSTLPNVELISNGKYDVPHFTNKAKVDALVSGAGFRYHSFVVAPFFYQNLLGTLAPQLRQDGTTGWTLPIDPAARSIHMGDITELGAVVAQAFSHPAQTGDGAYMNLIGDLVSFNDVVETLNRQGHRYTFQRVPADVFAGFFPSASELAEMFGYFEAHTYMGAGANERMALANRVSGTRPTNFATWAWSNMPVSKRADSLEAEGPLRENAGPISRRTVFAGTVAAAIGMAVPKGLAAQTSAPPQRGSSLTRKDKTMTAKLSPTLLTPETSLLLLLDYQDHVIEGIHSTDHALVELNGRALARASKVFKVPVILSTIGVKLRGDHPTLAAMRADLAEEPEYDRNTMNAWEDEAFREAIKKTGRRRLIFAGVWTEVCLLYPILHAQRDGFETYFVTDAVGGSTVEAHEMAIKRMIQAGSQPLTVNSLLTEWIRDWGTTPYTKDFTTHMKWYTPEIEKIRARLHAKPYQADLA